MLKVIKNNVINQGTQKNTFFDIETNQEIGNHEVNLAIIKDF